MSHEENVQQGPGEQGGAWAREKIAAIEAEMRAMGGLVVAFSGGVDSALVAALAQRALGEGAWAVTAVSETLAGRELEEAVALAAEIGIRHELVTFSELEDERFRANTPSRCFFCQSMRFDEIRKIAERVDCAVLASGTNFSDLGDHRPGLKAMEARRIYQPLLEHGVDKQGVRRMARELGLGVWDKPAKACLSSRIPHGTEVTRERLRRIEAAEEVLHAEGFVQFRVRDHQGLARLEVDPGELGRLLESAALLGRVEEGVRRAGFWSVCVDLQGFRSGSLNPRKLS